MPFRWIRGKKAQSVGFGLQTSEQESFWMMPKLFSSAILNLIATLSFLYHKSTNTR